MVMWPSLSVANWLSTFCWCEVKPNRKKDISFCWQPLIFNCCLATGGARCLKRRGGGRQEGSVRFSLISGGLLISEERMKNRTRKRNRNTLLPEPRSNYKVEWFVQDSLSWFSCVNCCSFLRLTRGVRRASQCGVTTKCLSLNQPVRSV